VSPRVAPVQIIAGRGVTRCNPTKVERGRHARSRAGWYDERRSDMKILFESTDMPVVARCLYSARSWPVDT